MRWNNLPSVYCLLFSEQARSRGAELLRTGREAETTAQEHYGIFAHSLWMYSTLTEVEVNVTSYYLTEKLIDG